MAPHVCYLVESCLQGCHVHPAVPALDGMRFLVLLVCMLCFAMISKTKGALPGLSWISLVTKEFIRCGLGSGSGDIGALVLI